MRYIRLTGGIPEPLGALLMFMLGNFLLTANLLLYEEILIYAYKKRKTVQIRRGRATVTDATRHNVTAFCGKTRQNGVRSQETPCMPGARLSRDQTVTPELPSQVSCAVF